MKDTSKQRWALDHDPEARPLGCNGLYGKSGYNKHKHHGEDPCEVCRISSRHYEREYRRGQKYPRVLKPCGTPAAAARHRANGEPVCFPCKLAVSADQAKRDKRRPRARMAA